jgi:hypothetical protein
MPVLKHVQDWTRESFPFFFYRKIGLIVDPFEFSFQLQSGFFYRVYRITARYNSENVNLPGVFADPLQLEFFKSSGEIALQLDPFDVSLFSSPGESGVAVDTAPGANPAYPFTAVPLNRDKALNVLYDFSEVIGVKISNITAITAPGDPTGSLPSFLELFIHGRYYPAYNQEGWGN